jgi:hypothetical protein
MGGQALADRQARTASTTQFEAHATLNVPPEELGLFIHIKLDGKIATTSHSKVVKSCRVSRDVRISWTRLDGTKVRGNSTYPTTRSGHFGAEFDIDYEKDVPSSGGPFKFTIVSPKDHVAGKRLGTSYTCKRLTETLTVSIPPELPAP